MVNPDLEEQKSKFIIGNTDSWTRDSVQGLASTSPEHLQWLCECLFENAIYPPGTEDHIRKLNMTFIFDFYEHIYHRYGRLESGKSTSALMLLYFYSRDFVGAVRALHALHLAQESVEMDKPETQLHFLARDGLSEYIAAQAFQVSGVHYPRFNYIPLSVKLMRQQENPLLRQYLHKQELDTPRSNHMLVDIGFTGEIPDILARMYPEATYIPRFLISRAHPEIIAARPVMAATKGFLYDQQEDPYPDVFGESQVVRALENTFGGLNTSATALAEKDGQIVTNVSEYSDSYDKARREIAIRGVRDSTSIFISAMQQGFTSEQLLAAKKAYCSNLANLIRFTSEPELLERVLFVPHEPTN